MTDDERNDLADDLFALVFKRRPDNGPKGQAWILQAATTFAARAVLASIGPDGDPSTLIELIGVQITQKVQRVQSELIRERLMAPGVKPS